MSNPTGAEGLDQLFLRSLNRIVERKPSAPAQLGDPVDNTVGEGTGYAPEPATDTAGIASPLTEKDASKRTYYPATSLLSSDGMLEWQIEPLESLTMTDADGNPVLLEFANPYA